MLGKMTSDTGSFFVGVVKVAKGANISVPKVTAESKTVEFNLG
jgi:hypothetical protein